MHPPFENMSQGPRTFTIWCPFMYWITEVKYKVFKVYGQKGRKVFSLYPGTWVTRRIWNSYLKCNRSMRKMQPLPEMIRRKTCFSCSSCLLISCQGLPLIRPRRKQADVGVWKVQPAGPKEHSRGKKKHGPWAYRSRKIPCLAFGLWIQKADRVT
jgi:hypothetical protein